jgi:adenylate kinase family enzyme
VDRVSVVGSSGAGKSTFAAKLAARIEAPHVELDGLWHDAGWTNPTPEVFRERVTAVTSMPRWVIDGNYARVTREGPVWEHADTVIVLAIPKMLVMRQIVRRTLRRAVTRQVLWNGNREPLSNFYRWDPERNVARWAWTKYDSQNEQYREAPKNPRYSHLNFVFLASHAESEEYLRTVSAPS